MRPAGGKRAANTNYGEYARNYKQQQIGPGKITRRGIPDKEEWIAEEGNHTEHESGPDCPIQSFHLTSEYYLPRKVGQANWVVLVDSPGYKTVGTRSQSDRVVAGTHE